MRGVAETHGDERSRVHRRVRRNRQDAAKVKAGVARAVNALLAGRGTLRQHRRDGMVHARTDDARQLILPAAEKRRAACPASEHADRHPRAGVVGDVLKQHRRSVHARRPPYRSARTDAAVDTGKLRREVHRDLRFYELARHRLQQRQRTAQIVHLLCHGLVRSFRKKFFCAQYIRKNPL